MKTTASCVTLSRHETSATVAGTGELDLRHSSEFSGAMDEAMACTSNVVVDLREAFFIDTAILACLAKCGKTLMDAGDRLSIIVIEGSHPDYVLKTVGFGQMMDIDAVPKDPD